MKNSKSLSSAALPAVLSTLILSFTAQADPGGRVPAKVRTSGATISKTYFANPAIVPHGTPFVHVVSAGEGNGTVLGKYTINLEFLVHLDIVNGALTAVWVGTWEATAANGDLLRGVFTNHQPFGSLEFTGVAETTGGTGRFEGATGFETTAGILTPGPGGLETFHYEHDGWMSSVGSGKRN